MKGHDHASEFRILIDTLFASFRGLVWSVLLIAGIIFGSAILMAQVSLGFFDDASIPLETRTWLHDSFGSTARASYTMFEITFTGGWIKYVRPAIFDVSMTFVLFLLPYVVAVNFAVMKVVSALFLKQTLAVAATDEQ